MLLNPEIIRATIDKLLRAFENIIQMELIMVRWKEVKKFQAGQFIKIPVFLPLK